LSAHVRSIVESRKKAIRELPAFKPILWPSPVHDAQGTPEIDCELSCSLDPSFAVVFGHTWIAPLPYEFACLPATGEVAIAGSGALEVPLFVQRGVLYFPVDL
jgi:hypothetical protein